MNYADSIPGAERCAESDHVITVVNQRINAFHAQFHGPGLKRPSSALEAHDEPIRNQLRSYRIPLHKRCFVDGNRHASSSRQAAHRFLPVVLVSTGPRNFHSPSSYYLPPPHNLQDQGDHSPMLPSSSAPVTRQLPSVPAASSTLRNLSKLIATITVDDIKGAELCGGGGFGDVYVLTHPVIGKLALKRVRTFGNHEQIAAQLRRSIREAETWRQLTHPNVLPFLDILERSSGTYLVSPFVQNGSLSDFVRRHPDMDRGRLIQETAAGIAYLHRSGIIHGDIKGANILISDDVRALLCDFGLARPHDMNTSVDMQGLGTARWQSPELLLSGTGKTFKSDVWAFGMTIYEVLSGRMPYYQYDSNTAVIIAVMMHKQVPPQEPATSPNGASYASLWRVAGDCWNEDPDQRPDMHETHDRLVLSGFRSLVLPPSSNRDGNMPNDIQIGSSLPTHLSFPDLSSTAPSARPGDQAFIASVKPGLQEQAATGNLSQSLTGDSSPATTLVESRRPGVRILKGHSDEIKCLAFSPDGQSVVSGSRDYTLRLWDVETGGQIGETREGHTDWVWCLEFSPDGKNVVSGSDDRTLRLWDVKSGLQGSEKLVGHTGSIRCLALSPDGKTIASGASDHTIRLWGMKPRHQEVKTLKGHTSWVQCVAFSPDGQIVVSGSSDHTIRLWHVETGGQKGRALQGHTDYVTCLAFSRDGRTVASGAEMDLFRLWDVDLGVTRGKAFGGSISSVSCVAFSPGGTTLASGHTFGALQVWNVESGRRRGRMRSGHTGSIQCLAFSPDGETVMSGCSEGNLRRWNAKSGELIGQVLEGHTESIICLAFSPDGRTVASGSQDRTLRLWNVDS